ncbi:head-tail adaptor protein [Lactobacillus sp. CRM56-2]|nr:head-tail adaptor protein [Lactobacillus sp. CRM56-2]
MTKVINPARMNFRLEFGTQAATGKVNPNTGNPITDFVPQFSLYAGEWSLSFQQRLALNGDTSQQNVYQIDDVAYDDGLPPDGFDLITCHKVVIGRGE